MQLREVSVARIKCSECTRGFAAFVLIMRRGVIKCVSDLVMAIDEHGNPTVAGDS